MCDVRCVMYVPHIPSTSIAETVLWFSFVAIIYGVICFIVLVPVQTELLVNLIFPCVYWLFVVFVCLLGWLKSS